MKKSLAPVTIVLMFVVLAAVVLSRSEERRVGKECA